jgi:PIN domain nuclease of toxin-antitoxin system
MDYLLDTSVWLRGALFKETLPSEAQHILEDASLSLGLSIYSLWEAAKKHQKGKLPLPVELADFPVNDPGDELIVATARIHRLTLLTTDTKLKSYRHARIRYFTPVVEKHRK